jgi:hypothetical protein
MHGIFYHVCQLYVVGQTAESRSPYFHQNRKNVLGLEHNDIDHAGRHTHSCLPRVTSTKGD